MKMNKKGFTLIELLAVIVVLAIIALIATPIVMSTIKKAQEGADARSVEAYGKGLESAYYQYLIDNPTMTAEQKTALDGDLKTLTVTNSGDTVTCGTAKMENEKVVLNNCTVGSRTQKYNYTTAKGASKTA